ncbi:MAG: dipeptidase [Chlamydiales bacterium]
MQIADLHCDLLAYLAGGKNRDIIDRQALCSLPQLQEGDVGMQTLAIFTETGTGAVDSASRQMVCYRDILALYGDLFKPLRDFTLVLDEKITITPAIENLSGFSAEKEPLDLCFHRLERFFKELGLPLYVSLTWNSANRFGGGNQTKIGLKRDGELFLEYIDRRNIAIDLSHTSDQLAHGILEYIDKKGLLIIPIASHSNCREVVNQPRNLSDVLIREIVVRGGVIGLNFVRSFIGSHPPECFFLHVGHMRQLDALDHLCMGADFFYEGTVAHSLTALLPFFHKKYGDASCYPQLFEEFSHILRFDEKEKLAHKNLESYFIRQKERVC